MTTFISPDIAARFQQLGSDTKIHSGGIFDPPERIAIGHNVVLNAPYTLRTITNELVPPVIRLGDSCQIQSGLTIHAKNSVILERNVLIGHRVYISDHAIVDVHPITKAPIPKLHSTAHDSCVHISEGAWIGTNVLIVGHVRIGVGSVVAPNSVVLDNVPDYCVVAGNPAVITQMYEVASSSWVQVSGNEQAKQLLASRRIQPMLSICIPTYNRASHLEHCLQSIYSQIGNNELIEVIVSDNASSDETAEIASRYASLYSNMRVSRNEENIGADPNIFKVMNLARGKFVKLQGDDDFYVDGTLMHLLHVLHSHSDCGVIQIFVRNGDGRIWTDTGMRSYLNATSIYATFITSIVLRRVDLEQIEEPALFLDSAFNQLYLQYAILEKNPRYCIMNCSMFTYAGLSSDEYNFGEIVFGSYPSILKHFVGKGLTEEDIAAEKNKTLFQYAIPWYREITQTKMVANTERFEDIFIERYSNESYFEGALALIRSIQLHQH